MGCLNGKPKAGDVSVEAMLEGLGLYDAVWPLLVADRIAQAKRHEDGLVAEPLTEMDCLAKQTMEDLKELGLSTGAATKVIKAAAAAAAAAAARMRLRVSGAGSKEANGDYKLHPKRFRGKPMYLHSSGNGFCIYYDDWDDWFICDNHSNNYYYNKADYTPYLPQHGWELSDDSPDVPDSDGNYYYYAKDPAPTVKMLGPDGDERSLSASEIEEQVLSE